MAGSKFGRSMRDARKTIVGNFFGKTIFGDDCPICFMTFEPGDKVEIFGCHPTHMIHEGCYAMFKKTNEKNGVRSVCPQCRFPIDESKITKKLLQKRVDEHEDPFYMKENEDGVMGTPRNKVAIGEPNAIHSQIQMPEVIAPR